MKTLLKKILREEKGQGLTEYAMILGFVAVAAIVVLVMFRTQIIAFFTDSTEEIDGQGFGE